MWGFVWMLRGGMARTVDSFFGSFIWLPIFLGRGIVNGFG
jgi:hypothetical protein